MAESQILLEEFDLNINTGTFAVPVWTPIGGITKIGNTARKTTIDTSNKDSGGYEEHLVIRRGESIAVDYQKLWDKDAGPPATRDAGQDALVAVSKLVGPAASGDFQITGPGTYEKRFFASADDNDLGESDHNSIFTVSVTLEITGVPTITQ